MHVFFTDFLNCYGFDFHEFMFSFKSIYATGICAVARGFVRNSAENNLFIDAKHSLVLEFELVSAARFVSPILVAPASCHCTVKISLYLSL